MIGSNPGSGATVTALNPCHRVSDTPPATHDEETALCVPSVVDKDGGHGQRKKDRDEATSASLRWGATLELCTTPSKIPSSTRVLLSLTAASRKHGTRIQLPDAYKITKSG